MEKNTAVVLRRTYTEIPQQIPESVLVVFPTDNKGKHDKGAALFARLFGAVLGQAIGLQGNTYAIITCDERGKGVEAAYIVAQIKYLYYYATHGSGARYTYIVLPFKPSCTGNTYSSMQIAAFFKEAGRVFDIPQNIIFNDETQQLIDIS
jgi:hypothetical protein